MDVKPVYNAGRWLVFCPTHGRAGAMLAESEYICPVCYPGIVARFNAVKGGRIVAVNDTSAQRTARKLAEQDGKIYTVKFPSNKDKIEAALSKLPEPKRNWSGESLDSLKASIKQTAHVIKNFEKRNKKLDGNDSVVIVR